MQNTRRKTKVEIKPSKKGNPECVRVFLCKRFEVIEIFDIYRIDKKIRALQWAWTEGENAYTSEYSPIAITKQQFFGIFKQHPKQLLHEVLRMGARIHAEGFTTLAYDDFYHLTFTISPLKQQMVVTGKWVPIVEFDRWSLRRWIQERISILVKVFNKGVLPFGKIGGSFVRYFLRIKRSKKASNHGKQLPIY